MAALPKRNVPVTWVLQQGSYVHEIEFLWFDPSER